MSHGIILPVVLNGANGISQHADVTLSKQLDKASPSLNLLVNGAATGLPVNLPIDFVTIDFRKTGTTPVVFYRMCWKGSISPVFP